MPVGKGNNKSKDDFGSVTPTNSERDESCNVKTAQHSSNWVSPILSMTKPDEHKGAISVVHIEAVKLFYARDNNMFNWFYNKTCMKMVLQNNCNDNFYGKQSPGVFLLKQYYISGFKASCSSVHYFLYNYTLF